MTMLEITFSWTAARTCTPDRLRSFLEYLGNRELPLRFNYEEQSLYAASEALLIGPTPQSIRLTGYATVKHAAFTVMFADASYRMSLGFHADRSVLELLEASLVSPFCRQARECWRRTTASSMFQSRTSNRYVLVLQIIESPHGLR